QTVNSTVVDVIHIETDHKLITLSLAPDKLFGTRSNAYQRQHKIRRTVFMYDQMNQNGNKKWEDYSAATAQAANDNNFNQFTYKSQDEINKNWNKIEAVLYKTALENIENKKVVANRAHDYNPITNSKLHDDLNSLTNLYVWITRHAKRNNY